jgi:polysaccharide biosynthesis protein PslH
MKILFVVPYVPNLIRVRPYNLVRNLAKRGHDISLLTLWTDDSERAGLEDLENVCSQVESIYLPKTRSLWNVLQALPTKRPLQSVYSWHPELARRGASLWPPKNGTKPFDIVHVEHLRGANYGLFLKSGWSKLSHPAGSPPPVIWDSVDSISHLFRQAAALQKNFIRRWITRFDLGRTEYYEGWLLSQFDRVMVTSPADRQALLSLTETAKTALSHISVLPNGVDLDYFSEEPRAPRLQDSLVISGKMSYHANISMTLHMVNHIMPLIWRQRPEVKLIIAGKDPPREILALTKNPAISVTGTVEDIRPYLKGASGAVVPITYGAGIQNKVLEAMASGTPVVSTSQAVSAIQAVPGTDLLVGQDVKTFAESVLCLLNDPQLRHRIGQNGRRYVEKNHHWDLIAEKLEAVYAKAINDNQVRKGQDIYHKTTESW